MVKVELKPKSSLILACALNHFMYHHFPPKTKMAALKLAIYMVTLAFLSIYILLEFGNNDK